MDLNWIALEKLQTDTQAERSYCTHVEESILRETDKKTHRRTDQHTEDKQTNRQTEK